MQIYLVQRYHVIRALASKQAREGLEGENSFVVLHERYHYKEDKPEAEEAPYYVVYNSEIEYPGTGLIIVQDNNYAVVIAHCTTRELTSSTKAAMLDLSRELEPALGRVSFRCLRGCTLGNFCLCTCTVM